MSFKLIFRKTAEIDLADIQDYYNKVSPKITDNFFKEFFATLNCIESEPQLFQVRYRGMYKDSTIIPISLWDTLYRAKRSSDYLQGVTH
jgi:hypothetical protein